MRIVATNPSEPAIPISVPEPWPPCPTPDCENRVCLWAGLGRCYPCSVREVGIAEMERRYVVTRVGPGDRRWNGVPAE
jgi:hypothetical protein